MPYKSITLKKELVIDEIASIHRFKSISDFVFHEEAHDFWEFLYVEKGAVQADVNSTPHTLNKDSILFCQPGEPHSVRSKGDVSSSLISIGFICDSPAIEFFRGKILEVSPSERLLLNKIVQEASLAYSCQLDTPCYRQLIRRDSPNIPFGSEQLIQVYLQQLLIQLIRNHETDSAFAAIPKSVRKRGEDELFYKIISYMEEHIDEHLSIQQICRDNLIGRSLLQQIFRDNTGYGIIDYFSLMKITAAKQLIRRQKMNFSQIAEHLGYNSIHYFSRQFKKLSGITPSEYAASIRLGTGLQESSPELPFHDRNRSQNAGHIFHHTDI